ncbi:helix-turn-helix domain-containing protein [Oleiharenicola lentus]|uniref:helix-turn-helix domain-containing protein n=1 Tax=Oleiharenicola lentus TaxID=2508720 RepID=UPI003F67B636
MSRAETLFRPVKTIIASEFNQGSSYTNWRPRGSGDWLLIYTVSGAGHIVLGERVLTLKAGQAILYSPSTPQDYRTDEGAGRWRLLWAHFQPRPMWRAWLRWPEFASGAGVLNFPVGKTRKGFEASLNRTVATLKRPHGDAVEFALNALEEALLWAQQTTEGNQLSRLDERVRKAMDYLATHSAETFRLESLAKHCGLSESRLSHLFKEETGETPQRYSEELRLRQAQQLLAHSSLRINEVAGETGFADPFYFAKRFRKFAGCTPSEYRERETR